MPLGGWWAHTVRRRAWGECLLCWSSSWLRGHSGPGAGGARGATGRCGETVSAGLRQRGRGGAEGAERAVGGRSVMGRRPRRGWGAQDRARGLGHLGAGQVHSRGSAEHAGALSAGCRGPCVRACVCRAHGPCGCRRPPRAALVLAQLGHTCAHCTPCAHAHGRFPRVCTSDHTPWPACADACGGDVPAGTQACFRPCAGTRPDP